MLLLIDGSTILFRSFHGLPTSMKTKSGEMVNATFGFVNTIVNLLDLFQPTHIACAFDTAAQTFRHKQYEGYKANRVEPPEGLFEQLPRILEFLEALQVKTIMLPGYEADDIIGTLSRESNEKQMESAVVSGDNDFVQLINNYTSFFCISRGLSNAISLTPANVVEKHGLRADQWIDYKALRGDPSDNLPGVPGIGEKTAKTLLQTWDTLDNLYLNLNKVTGSAQTKLREHEKEARFTKEMVTINCQTPLTDHLNNVIYTGPNNSKMKALCDLLAFNKLGQKYAGPETLF
jgi:DNA polymerase-1